MSNQLKNNQSYKLVRLQLKSDFNHLFSLLNANTTKKLLKTKEFHFNQNKKEDKPYQKQVQGQNLPQKTVQLEKFSIFINASKQLLKKSQQYRRIQSEKTPSYIQKYLKIFSRGKEHNYPNYKENNYEHEKNNYLNERDQSYFHNQFPKTKVSSQSNFQTGQMENDTKLIQQFLQNTCQIQHDIQLQNLRYRRLLNHKKLIRLSRS